MKNMITTLRRWLSGEGRASDERALDAAMRDDPFLAEAMEGYRAFADADHEKNLTRLRARLQEKSSEKRRGGLYLLPRAVAIAASVLVLAGMGWWLFRETPQDQLLSKNDTPASLPADTGTEQAIAQLEQPDAASGTIEQRDEPLPTTLYRYNRRSKELDVVPMTPAPEVVEEGAADDAARRDADFALSGEDHSKPKTVDKALDAIVKVESAESESGIDNKPATQNAAPATPGNRAREEAKKDMAAGKAAKEKQQNTPRNLKGRVTDDQGEPLIGVSVVVEGTKRGASTDADGNFNLPLSGDEERLVFQYTGFEPVTAPIEDQGPLNVTMKINAMALDEVVVTSAGRKQSKAKTQSAYKPAATAAPVNGTAAYETYLSQNLRYPDDARKKGIQGVVKLRFTVNATGKLSNFKVLQSLSKDCDEEAIRLIKEGPAWEINGDARKVQVEWEIQF